MHTRPGTWWLVLFILVLLIGAFELVLWGNHATVVPKPPESKAAELALPATTSHLSAPITLPTSAIAAALETAIPKSFPIDVRGDAHVSGNPSRSAISVKNDAGAKRVNVSTRVSGRVQVEKKIIINVSVGIDVAASINASFAPIVTKDWKVNPQLQLSVNVERVVAKTAVGDIDITGHVRGPISDALNKNKSKIEDALASKLNMRPDAESLWNKINGVHRLAESPPAWLRITPRAVTLANFSYTPTTIESGLALDLETHVFLQDKAPDVLKSPLPDLKVADALANDLDLWVPIEVSYGVINDQLKTQMSQKPFELGESAWVEVTAARLNAYGDGILLTVEFNGKKGLIKSASGTLYIVGVPLFNPAKAEMRVDKLDYTAETKSLLLKNVDWIAHSKLLDAMKTAAVVNLSTELEKAKTKANEELNKLKTQLPKEVGATVSVTEIAIGRLAFTKENAFVVLNVNGKMSARLNPR